MYDLTQEEADTLIKSIRRIALNHKDDENYFYEKKMHELYEPDATAEIRRNFYNEHISTKFINTYGQTIVLDIVRWHAHKHRGWSGLNGNPCYYAKIAIEREDESLNDVWTLDIRYGTMYFHAETTDMEIPKYMLKRNKTLQVKTLAKRHNVSY